LIANLTMNESQNAPTPSTPPQQRLKELQAIPDNMKTEAQWDELIELEIAMAQGGQVIRTGQKGAQHPGQGGKHAKAHGGGGGGGSQVRKPARKFHRKPPKQAPPGV